MSRNFAVLLIASITLAVLYVVAPVYSGYSVRPEYERLVDALWAAYIYVLPGILGVAVALLMSGSFSERVTKTTLALAFPIVVAFVWSGEAGAEMPSFRLSMIFLATAAAIYFVAGSVAAFVATRNRSSVPRPGNTSP